MSETDTHLSVEELAAYHAGTLAEDEEARVQDHLLECPECTRTLLDLDALRHGADPAEEASDAEKEAFWQALRPRLTEAEEESSPPGPLSHLPPTPRPGEGKPTAPLPAPIPFPARREVSDRSPRRSRAFQLLAATLAAAVVGLAIQNASLRQTVGELSQPALGAPVRDLSATSTREASAPTVITLAPDDRFFTLVLSPADPRDFPDHEVVLEKAGDGEVWRGRGLRKNDVGTFSVVLSRRMTDDGDYTLRILGIEGEAKRIVGEYHFRIETK